MKKQSEDLRKKLIGLGEDSSRKSYYPELQSKIRQLEESRQSLIDSYNQRRDFMRNILHELRTPLHGLGGLLRVLKGEAVSSYQSKIIDDMVQTLKRLGHLVGEVQQLADEGFSEIDFYGELKLNTVLENLVSPLLSKFSLEGDFQIVDETGELSGIQGKVGLFQLGLSNFLQCALRFDHLKKIKMVVSTGRDKIESIDLVFTLSFGEGILTDEQRKRFYSLLQESSRAHEGDKLEFIEEGKLFCFGGIAKVEALSPAQFSWIYRFDVVASELVEKSSTANLENDESLPNILLVEDNEINLSAMELILEDMPCNVYMAHNGKEAFELYTQHSFALIFMDMKMPVMGGEDAIVLIRDYEHKNNRIRTPIVAITAFAMAGDRERIIELGADDYLAKPFDFTYFESLVQKYSQCA